MTYTVSSGTLNSSIPYRKVAHGPRQTPLDFGGIPECYVRLGLWLGGAVSCTTHWVCY